MRSMSAALALIAGPTLAQAPPSLDARTAQVIVAACAAHAAARMQSEAIAVVDPGGHLIAGLRMDRTSYGMMEFGLAKAQAVAAWGFSTAEMGDAVKGTPGFASAPHVVTVAGGVPIYGTDRHTLIGAVGVSGEEPADDAACAEAGVRGAGLRTRMN